MDIFDKSSLRSAAMRNGVEPIGADQAAVAFTAVADNGDGTVTITAAAHGKLKNQCVAIVGGAYAGIYRILKVPSTSTIVVKATFSATTTGSLLATAYLDGYGFFVKKVPLTIASISPEDPSTNATNVIANTYNVGDEVDIPFFSIRLSAGDVEVVRKSPRANLTYSNR